MPTVVDIEATVRFYCGVLGMERQEFHGGRTALRFGSAKINLYLVDRTFEPKAAAPTPGSADLCFVASMPLEDVQRRLQELEIRVEEGPSRYFVSVAEELHFGRAAEHLQMSQPPLSQARPSSIDSASSCSSAPRDRCR